MKSVLPSCGLLLALACALSWSAASAESLGAKPRIPLLPDLDEYRQILAEARQHPEPLRRLPAPIGGPGVEIDEARRHSLHKRSATAAKSSFVKSTYVRRDPAGPQPLREPQPDVAGRISVPHESGLKIINGDTAKLGQFPWQAGVLAKISGGKAWCGGSIVHSLWILTAAHCVDDQADSYTISVGSLGSEEGSEPSRQVWQGVTEFYQHPMYNPYFIDNDVALIKLPGHISFNAWCGPVRLPSRSMAADMMVGKVGTVSGWGKRTDSDSWISPVLMYTQNTIDNGTACNGIYGNAWIPNKICVRTPDHHSFCSGDSGGAFTFEEEPGVHTQIGIVSFGHKKGCDLGYPTAYTRVASFLDFIEETTNIAIRD